MTDVQVKAMGAQRYGPVLLLIALTAILGGGQVWLAHVRIENNRTIQSVRADIESARQNIQKLRLELSSMTRPENLKSVARKKLGMQAPLPMQVVRP
ncbi:MAG: cell division protein FtsL [Zetaproteobacteria bacterium CG_4_9_14_3_um_filter_49_83]|nr:MAG: cell division protein FtsL [Zetaproteobacteria bacterium CG17_big_fil_post_rev_8_21_14_2_50_50_13]PIV29047.1 MAG: cell division protein FtsL [Zetaproteobacteria bacterium CG02_land_8_20_14_3_00_50_9]PIY56421.1 MAG: cell division protein FtsL [Zetaproteobacteria bacterium CG_4_10_14_0_8_um_filter_49_80]PJA34060.1 MAG: cell division protein FtsL [Zetaproteobacteria bacterium CG_4_9_14_3_um_filter_49_83]